MATPEEFEAAAVVMAAEADTVRGLLAPVRAATGPDVLAGGRFADSLDDIVDAGQDLLRAMADGLDDVAAELRLAADDERKRLTAAAAA